MGNMNKRKYIKPNILIDVFSNATLFTNQLIDYALVCLEEKKGCDGKSAYVSRISIEELKKVMDVTDLEDEFCCVTSELTGATVEEAEGWIVLIPRVDFENGVLELKFNPRLSSYFYNVKSNYTIFELSQMLKFKTEAPYKLYEYLKRKRMNCAGEGRWSEEISLEELCFKIGISNSSEIAKDILENVIEETNNISDISIEYEFYALNSNSNMVKIKVVEKV